MGSPCPCCHWVVTDLPQEQLPNVCLTAAPGLACRSTMEDPEFGSLLVPHHNQELVEVGPCSPGTCPAPGLPVPPWPHQHQGFVLPNHCCPVWA